MTNTNIPYSAYQLMFPLLQWSVLALWDARVYGHMGTAMHGVAMHGVGYPPPPPWRAKSEKKAVLAQHHQ